MGHIHFFKEDIRFRLLFRSEIEKWIAGAIRQHGCVLQEVNYIFCSDEYLLRLNKKFLNHNFYTDVITFDTAVEKKKISGDIFISYPRVVDNAEKFKATLKDELHRVMIHGMLHLLGYNDKSKKDRQEMRDAEEKWMNRRKF